MKLSIRYKLILTISTLMVLLFAIASYLFISEKKTELSQDIYLNTLAFSRLTASDIAYNYDLYLAQNGFVYFNRELASIFDKNDDIARIKIFSYDAKILYDSGVDLKSRYTGESRFIEGNLKDDIQTENIIVKLKDAGVVYLKSNSEGAFDFVDKDEQKIDLTLQGSMIDYFVVPANEKYSVYFEIDYHNLEQRVARMRMRIIYLALFGIMLGVMMSIFMSDKVTKPIASLVEGAENIAKANFKFRVNINSGDELSYLGKAFNKMAEDLEAGLQARLFKERKTVELQLATKIQDQLIPKKIPAVEGLDIAAFIRPAGEIGGDIYDFLPMDSGKLRFYLGDVTGHGIPAGIVSSIANALFYGYAKNGNLKEILVDVNAVLKVKTMSTMFMTLCLMEWDNESGKFSYVSAGHEQLVHFNVKTSKTELTHAGGLALGMVENISDSIELNFVNLEVGDFLIVYSDGITEAWNKDKMVYGIDRLRKIIEKSQNLKTASQMAQVILKDVDSFRKGFEQMDDITLIVVKRV